MSLQERIAAPETSDAGATLRVRTIRSDGTPVPFVTLTAIEIDDAVDEGSEELARLARRGFRFKGNSDRSGSGGLQVSARRRLAVRAVQCTDVTAAGFARARTLQRAGLRSREHPWRIELERAP